MIKFKIGPEITSGNPINKFVVKGQHDLNDADYESAEFEVLDGIILTLGFDFLDFAKKNSSEGYRNVVEEKDMKGLRIAYLEQITEIWRDTIQQFLGVVTEEQMAEYFEDQTFFRHNWEAMQYAIIETVRIIFYDPHGTPYKVIIQESE